jgi:hypothetical protein
MSWQLITLTPEASSWAIRGMIALRAQEGR